MALGLKTGPRAEKCYFTPANSVLKFNFTPARAKMIVFYWRMRMSFWSRPSGRDFKLIRMRQQNNHLAHEIQTLFFLQPLFKPLLIKFILQNDQTFKLPACAGHLVTNFCKIFLGCFNFFFHCFYRENSILYYKACLTRC
jgi:hypothetical protein